MWMCWMQRDTEVVLTHKLVDGTNDFFKDKSKILRQFTSLQKEKSKTYLRAAFLGRNYPWLAD